MTLQLIRIGNSRGIRIPKAVLEQCALHGSVRLTVRAEGLLISPTGRARDGWERAFRSMASRGDDALLDAPTAGAWDRSEWQW